MKTHTVGNNGAELVYDLHAPTSGADGKPALVMIGQPMDASGFRAQLEYFTDRTVITYDPRGMGRSTRTDGRVDQDPETHAGDVYEAQGWGAGMAAFLQMAEWQGEFTDAYFDQPASDPAAFGVPTEDDGSRDDPLLSDRSWAISDYRSDAAAINASPTRVIIAIGEESTEVLTGRTAEAAAQLLGQSATVFPSHHSGFMGGEFGQARQPEAFAARLREVLDV